MHFVLAAGEDVHGEFFPYDGETIIWLGGHCTIYGLLDTLIHESLHAVIEENCPEVTTEEQDHWIIQRICF